MEQNKSGGIPGYAFNAPRGRPKKFETALQLANKVDEYFEYIKGCWHMEATPEGNERKVWDREPEPATITRLALYLGFSTRQGLLDYNENEEFAFVIKHAKTMVEFHYEAQLSGKYPTGAVFALKNLGWTEHKTISHVGLPEAKAPVINVLGSEAPPLASNESEITT